MNKRIWTTLAVATLLGVAMLGLRHIKNLDNQIQLKQIDIKDNSAKLKLLDSKYTELNKELDKTGADKAKVEEQLKQLQIERDKLQADLQAKKIQKEKDLAVKAQQAAQATVAPQKVAAASGCNTGNQYKDYIYAKESGCNPSAVNSIGCRGIGQACPGTKLPCGASFECQDTYFSNYAISRYGSWQAAYNWWLQHSWW